MIKFSTYLDKPSKTDSFIMMNVICNGFRLQVSTGIKIKPNEWDRKNKRIKQQSKKADYNKEIERLQDRIKSFYNTQEALNQLVTKEKLRTKIEDIKKPLSNEEKSFFDYYNDFIKFRSTLNKESTIKKFETLKNHLLEFQSFSSLVIDFNCFDDNFYNKFRFYLNFSKNINNNTSGFLIKTLKTFLYYAADKNIFNSTDFKKALKIGRQNGETESQAVALNFDELSRIESFTSNNTRLMNVKDLFLIQCYTGLRYSDLANLKPVNINLSEEIIKLHAIKTATPLVIPIHKKIKHVFVKHIEGLPVISNQKYNLYLKELCRQAEIDTLIETTNYYGTQRVDQTKPKYEMVSSHTARRTMITLALKRGIIPELIMKISGHKSRKSFDKYIKLTQEEAIEQFKKLF